jgi:hypothetical protein
MPDFSPVRPPRWYAAATVGFIVAVVGVSVAGEPSQRIALATGAAGAVVALALVELAVLWLPRR